MAITGLLANWLKSTTTAIAGNTGGELAVCVVMALEKMRNSYVDSGMPYFFEHLNKLMIPRLEAEKKTSRKRKLFIF